MNRDAAGDQRRRDARAAALERLLTEVGSRAEIARRLEPPSLDRLLRSIVEATVDLFDAEAASIALAEDGGRLRFRVAAGERGAGVVGVQVEPGEGIAGYVQQTGQPLALSDVAGDPRFRRDAAERTGYVPRSILAVPLQLGERVIGVLEVLDKRGSAGFDLADVERAGVFARQAAVAIDVSSTDRGIVRLLADALAAAASGADATSAEVGDTDAGLEELIAEAVGGLETDPAFWALVDRLAGLRAADPARTALAVDLLEVAIAHLAPSRPAAGATASWRSRAGLPEQAG